MEAIGAERATPRPSRERGRPQARRGRDLRAPRGGPAAHRAPLLALRRRRRRRPAAGLEILLRKAPSDGPAGTDPLDADGGQARGAGGPARARADPRRPRRRDPEPGAEDWVALLPAAADGPAERAERREAIARSREALQALKPQELRALTLLAEGYSYAEIGEITGWSARRRSTAAWPRAGSASAACSPAARTAAAAPRCGRCSRPSATARPAPRRSAELREHLRACATCRATLRAYRAAPAAAAALAPALPLRRSLLERAHDALAELAARFGGGRGDAALSQVAGGGRRRRRRAGGAGEGRGGLHRHRRRRRGLRRRPGWCRRRSSSTASDAAPRARAAGRAPAGDAGEPRAQPAAEAAPAPKPQPEQPSIPSEAAPRADARRRPSRTRRSEPEPVAAAPVEYAPPPPEPVAGTDSRRSTAPAAAARPGSSAREARSWRLLLAAPAGALACARRRRSRRPRAARSTSASTAAKHLARRATASGSTGTRSPGRPTVRPRRPTGSATPTGQPGRRLRPSRSPDNPIDRLDVPPAPGAYTARSLARGRRRQRGPAGQRDAALRRRRPAPAAPLARRPAGSPATSRRGRRSRTRRAAAALGHPRLRGLGRPRQRQLALRQAGPLQRRRDRPAAAIDGDTLSLGTLPEGVDHRPRRRRLRLGRPLAGARAVALVASTPPPRPSRCTACRRAGATARCRLTALATRRALGDGGRRAARALHRDRGRRRRARRRARRRGLRPGSAAAASTASPTSRRDAAGNVGDGGRPPPASARSGSTKTRRRSPSPPPRTRPNRSGSKRPSPTRSPGRAPTAARSRCGRPAPAPASSRCRRAVAGDRLVAHWDSDSYPPGKYEFLATGYDAAGNSAAGTDRARRRPDGPRQPAEGAGRPASAAASAALRRPTAPLPPGASFAAARTSGRLRRGARRPQDGRSVDVETFAAGAEPRAADDRGPHRRPTAPSRCASRRGRAARSTPRFAGTRPLTRAAARGRPPRRPRRRSACTPRRRRARVGGAPVVFSGRVARPRRAEPPPACRSSSSSAIRGGGWSEFRTVQTDAHGRFRYAYAFSDDDSRGVRFQFRAYVKGREGWPYEPGTSRPSCRPVRGSGPSVRTKRPRMRSCGV